MKNEKSQSGTVDRFEGGFALIELPDKKIVSFEKTMLDPDIVEGDRVTCDSRGIWHKDAQATDDARRRIRKLMDDLFE